MNKKNLNLLKNKLINILSKNGDKYLSQILFLKCCKNMQKTNFKDTKEILKLAIINSTYVVFNKKIKRKKKKMREFPYLLNKSSRVTLAIKSILKLALSNNNQTYKTLSKEFVLSAQNLSETITQRNNLHQHAFFTKKYAKYRWFK
jgi:ribosomal protein S7